MFSMRLFSLDLSRWHTVCDCINFLIKKKQKKLTECFLLVKYFDFDLPVRNGQYEIFMTQYYSVSFFFL